MISAVKRQLSAAVSVSGDGNRARPTRCKTASACRDECTENIHCKKFTVYGIIPCRQLCGTTESYIIQAVKIKPGDPVRLNAIDRGLDIYDRGTNSTILSLVSTQIGKRHENDHGHTTLSRVYYKTKAPLT